MTKVIENVLSLTREFATLKSPLEVYIFALGVWLIGVSVGALFG